MDRILRFLNVLIVFILLAAMAAGGWYLWRPMPKTSGSIEAGVRSKVTVVRDDLGVPHIAAASIEDALYGQGYVTAQDRLWQMDAIRRLASGELAELIGARAVESDREARQLRLRRLAEEHARTLPAADKRLLAAYARGVNDYIDRNRSRLSVEFKLLSYQPRPWSIADSLVIALQMYRTLTSTWRDEILKRTMLLSGDAAKVNLLFPVRSGSEFTPGSNAWAISGKHTASGKPLLASDPHIEFSFPATWYQTHIQGGALDVIGVSLPGIPGVIIGHNQRIAWGMTNLGYDVQDLYVERLEAASRRYLYRGKVEQARAETEIIRVRGAAPIQFQQIVTQHGPVVLNDGGQLLALRWTAAEPGSFQFPIIDLNLAQDWTQFRAALKRHPGPGQNLVYADVDGNIGYQSAGLLPIRKNSNGDIPVDGASGEFEWEGFIPFEELPTAFNPPGGRIISANQNPWPKDTSFRLNGEFAAPYRAAQIKTRLERRENWKPHDMLILQTDVYSAFLHRLARETVAAWERKGRRNASLTDPARFLKDWNGQMDKDSAAALIANLLYQHLKRQVAEKASPRSGPAYQTHMASAVMESLIASRPPDWFEDWDAKLVEIFSDAVEEGKRMQGADPSKWRYGLSFDLTLPHPVFSRVLWIGGYFTLGPVPMSGSGTTVKQATARAGPSMRFVADLSNWDASLNNITIGQSGHPLSSHFKDQWKAYYAGDSFPMQFRKIDATDTLELTPAGR